MAKICTTAAKIPQWQCFLVVELLRYCCRFVLLLWLLACLEFSFLADFCSNVYQFALWPNKSMEEIEICQNAQICVYLFFDPMNLRTTLEE